LRYNFEWDSAKAKINIKKHKVNFENAATVFKDPRAISIFDDGHSQGDERWVTIGLSTNGLLFVVHHTYNEIDNNNVNIRIISSRKATRKEQKSYRMEQEL